MVKAYYGTHTKEIHMRIRTGPSGTSTSSASMPASERVMCGLRESENNGGLLVSSKTLECFIQKLDVVADLVSVALGSICVFANRK